MEQRIFGSGGQQLPVIGLGTWEMEHDANPTSAIHRALELGMTHIDTAEMYGSGQVESIVGAALKGRREQAFLSSKVLPFNASAAGTLAACERSLKRLQTDYLDLYLLHWPGSYPLTETIEAFEYLRSAGKIRAYGVSNFAADELRQVDEIAGAGKIACNQVLYHAGERALEHRLLDVSRELAIPVVAYSPFGHDSMLSPRSPGGHVMAEIATQRGVSVHQVALRFVVRDPLVFTIPKASQLTHLSDNAAAGTWALSSDEVERLERACPVPSTGPGMPML